MKRNESEIYHRLSSYENEERAENCECSNSHEYYKNHEHYRSRELSKNHEFHKNGRFLTELGALLIGLGTLCGMSQEAVAQNTQNNADFSPKSLLERIRPPFMREQGAQATTDLPGGFTEPSGMGNETAVGSVNGRAVGSVNERTGTEQGTFPSTLSENWTPIGTSYNTPTSSIPPTAGTGSLLNTSVPYNPSSRAGRGTGNSGLTGNSGVTGNAGLTGNTGNTGSSRHVGSVGNTRNAGISGTSVSAEIVGNGKNGVISENTGNRVNGENIINGVNYGSNYDANYGMVTDASGLPAPFPVDKREFHLPFGNFLSVLPAEQLREIRLYVSRDNGNTWHTYQTLTREQIQKLPNKNFGVRTNTDGEIWFSLRVVNLQGTETPGESKQPTWRVLVNTTGKPLNTVVNNGNRTGNQAENAVRNQSGTVAGASSGTLNGENPPSGNIFAAPGMLNRPQWTPTADGKPTGNALADGNGTVSENRAAQNPNLVVYSVKDRGTNTIPDASLPVYKIPNSRPIEAFQNFTADGSGNESGSGNTKQHATAKPMDDGLGDLSGLDSLDGNDAISGDSASSGDSVSENDSTASSDDMFLMLGDAPGADDGLNTRIRYINQPGLSVDYDVSTVGSSGVGRVELWGTLDDGQTWTYMAEDKDCTSPVNLNLKSDGKYGFQILIFNGAGVGMERPQAGSAPQMEVVLDRINPRVQLYTIQLQAEFGDLEITWGAEDLNLGTNPVLLSWSSSTEGPWRAMTSVPLENTGRFVWRIPDGVPGKVYIRLDVCDLSKNSTTLVTGPVVTDIMRPTGVILDAKPTN